MESYERSRIESLASHDSELRQIWEQHLGLKARLEQMNKELETRLLVSEATMEHIDAAPELKRIGTVSLRGRRRTVDVYAPGTAETMAKSSA